MSKYNLNKVNLDDDSYFEATPIAGTDEETVVLFKENCFEIYGKEYNYNEFDIRLSTSNYKQRIYLAIDFTFLNSGEEYNPYLTFALDGRLIAIIDKFKINIQNREELDYIINHKEDAFKQIYLYSYIRKIKK